MYSKRWRRCDGVVGLFVEKNSFIVLLLRLGLVGFSTVNRVWVRVSVRITARVMFNFSDRVGIGLPNVE